MTNKLTKNDLVDILNLMLPEGVRRIYRARSEEYLRNELNNALTINNYPANRPKTKLGIRRWIKQNNIKYPAPTLALTTSPALVIPPPPAKLLDDIPAEIIKSMLPETREWLAEYLANKEAERIKQEEAKANYEVLMADLQQRNKQLEQWISNRNELISDLEQKNKELTKQNILRGIPETFKDREHKQQIRQRLLKEFQQLQEYQRQHLITDKDLRVSAEPYGVVIDSPDGWSLEDLMNSDIEQLIAKEPKPKITTKAEHLINPKSFKEWLNKEQENQTAEIDENINQLNNYITNYVFSFGDYNTEGRKYCMTKLLEFLTGPLQQTVANNRVAFDFHLRGEEDDRWHSKPLEPQTLQDFINKVQEGSLTWFEEWGNDNSGAPSDSPDWEIPKLCFMDKFVIRHLKPSDPAGALTKRKKSVKQREHSRSVRKDRGGNFFNYLVHDVPKVVIDYLVRLQIFDKLLTYDGKVREELNDNCAIYALKQSGIPDSILEAMKCLINSRFLSPAKLNTLCLYNYIHCVVHYIDDGASKTHKSRKLTSSELVNGKQKQKTYLGVAAEEAKYTITLNCYEQHYFIEEVTPFSTYFINNINTCPAEKYDKEFRTDRGTYRKARTFIKSGDLVRQLFKQDKFKGIKYGEYGSLKTTFYNELKDFDYNLEYEDSSVRPIKVKLYPNEYDRSKYPYSTIFFADFEADVTGPYHQPYMCCIINIKEQHRLTFKGPDCGEKLLKCLPDKSLVYFHNLSYDCNMFVKYGITKNLPKGSKQLMIECEYEGRRSTFKDTNAFFNCKVSDLPARYGLDSGKKELFPYNYYTLERLKSNKGIISEAGKYELIPWTQEQYDEFNKNIDEIGARTGANEFDMYKYSEFYCMQDVNIIRKALIKFSAGMAKFGVDVTQELTISGCAYKAFAKAVYGKNKELYELGGHVQHYVRQAIKGGRCMTAYNKKWHTEIELSDFDAVSLYPSAMSRLYTVEGKPKVITQEQLNLDFLSKQSAYVVTIKITKVNKHYPFPLIVYKSEDGLNVNDDQTVPVITTVDNITLEDFIKYQHIEFELIKGYYWDGAKDYTIQEFIKRLFNERLKLKADYNPLQELYKLIMNSCYGKCIQKPVKYTTKIIDREAYEDYYIKHYHKIVETIKISGSDKYLIKLINQIDNQYTNALLGVQILSMSKRIMNEVMCLAYDLGIKIFYQDTDSMHIEKDKLELLATEYKKLYGRELIGKQLGQFHNDFDEIADGYAIESYFVAKKLYVDKLTNDKGQTAYHIRGKGLTQNSIKELANTQFNGEVMELYKALYEGEELTFNLLAGKPSFKQNDNFSIESRDKFDRKVSSKLLIGDIYKYFQ